MNMNIAIDGPAGAGKSTIAKRLARELGYIYVDTGAMYRAMACYFLQNGIASDEEGKIAKACPAIDIAIHYQDLNQLVFLNGEDVSSRIREEAVGKMASSISVYPSVRQKLLELQRTIAKENNVIMDGRDIGTVILPDADVKIYLTASTAVRARRRYRELCEKGITCKLEEVEQDIIERDERDKNRTVSPLRQAEDAVLLDTSELDIDGVIAEMKRIIPKKRGMP